MTRPQALKKKRKGEVERWEGERGEEAAQGGLVQGGGRERAGLGSLVQIRTEAKKWGEWREEGQWG